MVKAILRTKRIIFYVIKNPTQNTNGPILLNAWGFDHLVSDRQKVLKTEQCLANIQVVPSSTWSPSLFKDSGLGSEGEEVSIGSTFKPPPGPPGSQTAGVPTRGAPRPGDILNLVARPPSLVSCPPSTSPDPVKPLLCPPTPTADPSSRPPLFSPRILFITVRMVTGMERLACK